MADFKGFKQVTLSTYQSTSEENRKDFLWFVREFSGETVVSSAIYFGNRKYADLTGDVEDPRVANILATLGDFVDENGEWVGFLPIEEHEILGNSGITSVSDALSALEAAILSNEAAIAGKVSQSDFDTAVDELQEAIEHVAESVSSDTRVIEELETAVDELKGEVATKAEKADVDELSGKTGEIEGKVAEVEERADAFDDALSAVSAELETKANASDVYTKDEVYTKEETDAKVAGAFKFKGNAEAISEDETTLTVNGEPVVASESNIGFVYQIDDAEYASNGSKWVKLGFNIDLTNYATKDFVNSGLAAEAAEREALAEEVELVQSALTKEIEDREALEEKVETLEDSSTVTANTYSEAEELQNLQYGKIVYVLNEESVSGITYGAGAYIYTQDGLKKLDSTTPSTSTTLEERVENLETNVGAIKTELGNTEYSGSSITSAIAELQICHVVTGDDVE